MSESASPALTTAVDGLSVELGESVETINKVLGGFGKHMISQMDFIKVGLVLTRKDPVSFMEVMFADMSKLS